MSCVRTTDDSASASESRESSLNAPHTPKKSVHTRGRIFYRCAITAVLCYDSQRDKSEMTFFISPESRKTSLRPGDAIGPGSPVPPPGDTAEKKDTCMIRKGDNNNGNLELSFTVQESDLTHTLSFSVYSKLLHTMPFPYNVVLRLDHRPLPTSNS